jgi:hypothetical protein
MIPVYQTLIPEDDGQDNCFNACVASILERPLRDVAGILPSSKIGWVEAWAAWFKENNLVRLFCEEDQPPKGYSIVMVYSERTYPVGHAYAGSKISHACVAFNGIIVHDPYPIPTKIGEIKYYVKLEACPTSTVD